LDDTANASKDTESNSEDEGEGDERTTILKMPLGILYFRWILILILIHVD